MEIIRIIHRSGVELDIVVPVFEICKLATKLSIGVAEFRNHQLGYGYIHCRNVLLKNFYARVIGSRYRVSLPPFTFNEPDTVQIEPQLIDQINELPDDIKCEIMSRVPGAQNLCKGVVRMIPPELKYASIIPFACAQWAMTHRSSYTDTVLERACEFMGPELMRLLPYATQQEATTINIEAQLRADIDRGSIKLGDASSVRHSIPSLYENIPDDWLTMSLDDYFRERRSNFHVSRLKPSHAAKFTPVPGSNLKIWISPQGTEMLDGAEFSMRIDETRDLYKLFTAIPDRWRELFAKRVLAKAIYIHDYPQELRTMIVAHPTIESLVQHGKLVKDLSAIPSVL